jgi:hypothetical protein
MFLDQRRDTYPAHLNVIELDNGKFHQSSSLKIPDNILLIFQPPYSPELNLGENMVTHKTRTEERKSLKISMVLKKNFALFWGNFQQKK